MSQVQSADFQSFQNVTIVGATETLIGASVPAAVESPTVKCSIKVLALVALGAGAPSVTLRIYRGRDVTGLLVGGAVAQLVGDPAATLLPCTAVASDQLQNAGQAQYCVSASCPGATANGSVALAAIEVMVLSG